MKKLRPRHRRPVPAPSHRSKVTGLGADSHQSVAEVVRNVDLGIDTDVSYSSRDHNGLEKVYFTTVEDGRFVPLEDWTRWAKP